MIAQLGTASINHAPIVIWEPLPQDFQLGDNPVENDGQPLLAGALRESLERSESVNKKKKERLMVYIRSQGIDPDNLPSTAD